MWVDLLKAAIEEEFGEKLERAISALGLSTKEFAEESNIPESTLYKIISGKRDLRVSTLKQIIKSIRKRENLENDFTIAIITTRAALDMINRRLDIGDRQVAIKEYPAMTIEEEVILGITAEKDGVKGIVCGPIAANTLERVVAIPVVALRFEEKLLLEAVNNLMKKI